MITIAMWVHVYLAATVVMEHARTENPIWGELRTVTAIVSVLAVWVGLYSLI